MVKTEVIDAFTTKFTYPNGVYAICTLEIEEEKTYVSLSLYYRDGSSVPIDYYTDKKLRGYNMNSPEMMNFIRTL